MMRLTIAVPKIKHLKVLNPHVDVRGKGWASSSMRMMPLKGVHSKSCLVVREALSLKLGGRGKLENWFTATSTSNLSKLSSESS